MDDVARSGDPTPVGRVAVFILELEMDLRAVPRLFLFPSILVRPGSDLSR
jgi:hypothetical protein